MNYVGEERAVKLVRTERFTKLVSPDDDAPEGQDDDIEVEVASPVHHFRVGGKDVFITADPTCKWWLEDALERVYQLGFEDGMDANAE